MAFVSEDRIDLLEEKLRAKVDTMTGFSDVEGKSGALEKVFKYFDTERTGKIAYSQFFAAMTRLNFVGVQRELENLFDRYDEDCSNIMDYKSFCDHLFGMGEHIAMNSTSRSVVERVKARIFARAGVGGLRSSKAHLNSIDRAGAGLLTRSELCEGLASFGLDADDGPGGDVDKVMGFFDRDSEGRISIHEFHRGLRGNMPKRRKLVVKEAFERLAMALGGSITVQDIRRCYRPSSHPDVSSGLINPEQALKEVVSGMCPGEDDEQAQVSFRHFLDYFRDISTAIENDEYFQALVLESWTIPAMSDDRCPGEGCERSVTLRALVTHSDGIQEVLEIEDGRGIDPGDPDLIRQRLERQGVQDIASVSVFDG